MAREPKKTKVKEGLTVEPAPKPAPEPAATVSTEPKQRPSGLIPYQPGQSGNPAGRPKGSRNKLGEAFLADLYANWLENGVDALEKVRIDKPEVYVKVVASILPQQLHVTVNDLDELSDDQLDKRIDALARALKLEIGAGAASRGQGPAPPGKSLN